MRDLLDHRAQRLGVDGAVGDALLVAGQPLPDGLEVRLGALGVELQVGHAGLRPDQVGRQVGGFGVQPVEGRLLGQGPAPLRELGQRGVDRLEVEQPHCAVTSALIALTLSRGPPARFAGGPRTPRRPAPQPTERGARASPRRGVPLAQGTPALGLAEDGDGAGVQREAVPDARSSSSQHSVSARSACPWLKTTARSTPLDRTRSITRVSRVADLLGRLPAGGRPR